MKLKIHSPIIAAIAGVLFSVGAVQGDDKAKGKETKPAPAQAIPSEALKALEDLGLDPEMVKKMKKMHVCGFATNAIITCTLNSFHWVISLSNYRFYSISFTKTIS